MRGVIPARILQAIEERSLRKRQTIAGFRCRDRSGTYWGIRSHIDNYQPLGGVLPCPFAQPGTCRHQD
jgi:hypothetical protein